MNGQAGFTLRGRNPDVLTCIANLSNDEVFTPPEFANRMLDTLADAWAASNGGANIWADSTVTFLDPFTKSGVFLREITTRLVSGLAEEIPDLQTRVDHILTRQVFGIAITTLTSLLARRSLYCSKHANGEHSVSKGFANDGGNVWFERTEHSWQNGKCEFCGAPRTLFDRGPELENHAYAFIHTDNIKARIGELFGAEMQFDVIIGNPPYQLKGGGGGTNDSSIYQLFVEQAMDLEPRFLVMVIPSRWLAGGRDMGAFRQRMFTDGHVRELVDYTKMSTAFPGVDFEGGVGYFLWDRETSGPCRYTLFQGDEQLATVNRKLDDHDIFVRDTRALAILDKVLSKGEPTLETIVSGDTPFGLATNFSDYSTSETDGSLAIYLTVKGRRTTAWVNEKDIKKNRQLIPGWKVLLPEAYGERGAIPAMVLGPPIVAVPDSVCTQTYLVAGPFASELAARSFDSYYRTRLFRFLVSLRKITQHALRSTYSWVPQQSWSQTWTDEILYQKYGIDPDEAAYIENMIRPMEANGE
ncbi:Eco57I restriction-modification methylase domain-containing protein [Brucella anthropi]|uniref:Eco57I restriction-modification methylase domain-containing protein n=1 Tax=Brucella anthropi TaxID=529 RepID=UPI002447C893|nr:Eco57I restriction-modification methylase domain-containing protein [Brucella anthropi]MDH0368465.1 Eco57I restriction-modification methylase domain-containing protein [Brucella anthropi]